MQLDVLSLGVEASRVGGSETRVSLKATVVPVGHDTIRLGARHIFAEHNFQSTLERIEALVWVRADVEHFEHVKLLVPENLRGDAFAGYGHARFPKDGGDSATLSFVLLTDHATFAEILRQVDGVEPGSIRIVVWINGLKFGLPDEEIWERHDSADASQYLPISHFTVEVTKLRTTRQAIRELRDTFGNEELADSDKAAERNLAKAWMKDRAWAMAEYGGAPSLAMLRQLRALVALVLLCAVVAILQHL